MIIYQLSSFLGDVTVSLDVSSRDETALIYCQGDEDAVSLVYPDIKASYGAFGHLLGERTTAIDLSAAMHKDPLLQYQPQLTSGEELVASYEVELPEGEFT